MSNPEAQQPVPSVSPHARQVDGMALDDVIEQVINRTCDPRNPSLPAVTALIYRVCGNDEGRAEEGLDIVRHLMRAAYETAMSGALPAYPPERLLPVRQGFRRVRVIDRTSAGTQQTS